MMGQVMKLHCQKNSGSATHTSELGRRKSMWASTPQHELVGACVVQITQCASAICRSTHRPLVGDPTGRAPISTWHDSISRWRGCPDNRLHGMVDTHMGPAMYCGGIGDVLQFVAHVHDFERDIFTSTRAHIQRSGKLQGGFSCCCAGGSVQCRSEMESLCGVGASHRQAQHLPAARTLVTSPRVQITEIIVVASSRLAARVWEGC